MPRPRLRRRICGRPSSHYFKPAGIGIRELDEVILTQGEFEALRLKDLQGLSQEESAKEMEVSQPTFHRILLSARKKTSEAIIKGKAIKIME
ncbi:MAG: DUF134 domain-containing protein [Nanoarchaeota archaeon]|nr:DUF134 domain-containing protein [Nanoarchaeota archaeon]